jgi:hypothetical protein
MKFIEFNDADGSHVLLNPKHIVAVLPYYYTRNDEAFEGTKIYCTDGDTLPFRFPADYDTVKKLLEGAEE